MKKTLQTPPFENIQRGRYFRFLWNWNTQITPGIILRAFMRWRIISLRRRTELTFPIIIITKNEYKRKIFIPCAFVLLSLSSQSLKTNQYFQYAQMDVASILSRRSALKLTLSSPVWPFYIPPSRFILQILRTWRFCFFLSQTSHR